MVAEKEIPKGFQKTEVGIIPSDWGVESIGKIATISVGGDLKKRNIQRTKTQNIVILYIQILCQMKDYMDIIIYMNILVKV